MIEDGHGEKVEVQLEQLLHDHHHHVSILNDSLTMEWEDVKNVLTLIGN